MISGVAVRSVVALALVVALVVAGLSSDSPLPPGSQPQQVRPEVLDRGEYLNGGYAQGAHLETYPGNLLGISPDGSIAATWAEGGYVTGYRLRTREVAWVAGGADNPVALQCHVVEDGFDFWIPFRGAGVALCWRDGPIPVSYVGVDLATGELFDYGELTQFDTFEFLAFDGDSLVLSVLTHDRKMAVVGIAPGGAPVYSSTFATLDRTERLRSPCRRSGSVVICSRLHRTSVFNLADGTPLVRFRDTNPKVSGSWSATTHGFRWVSRDSTITNLYDRTGRFLGATATCPLIPGERITYATSDYQEQSSTCTFKLIGPSGRVFAEFPSNSTYVLLTQAQVRVPLTDLYSPFCPATVSYDETVVGILSDSECSEQEVRLFDATTGRVLASAFTELSAQLHNGIVFFTEPRPDPDNEYGTQVLVPGS